MTVQEKVEGNWTDLYVIEKINGQVYYLTFMQSCAPGTISFDTLKYNVVLSVYNKRRDAGENERKKRMTGSNPFGLFNFAKNAFPMLLEKSKEEAIRMNKPLCIVVGWVDDKRRITYEKYLSRFGFHYARNKRFLKFEKTLEELKEEKG